MDKFKRIGAIATIAVIVICIISAFVFAILTYAVSPKYVNALRASVWSMVVVPIFVYALFMLAGVLRRKKGKTKDSIEDKSDN